MDLQKFHELDENLTSKDVAQLKFLSMDLIPKKRLEAVIDAKDLFLRLDEQALLDDGLLVPELLITIGRLDLLEILETSKVEAQREILLRDDSSKGISAYRKMLLSISEDVTEENFRSVKFLLDLPSAKLGASPSFLDVLIVMEKQQRLGEDNLDELYNILLKCDRQLASKIEQFRNVHREQGGRLPLQEVFPNDPDHLPHQRDAGNARKRGSLLSTDSDTPLRSDEYYKMTQRPLGYCLIINNYKFEERCSLRNRTGTHKDKEELNRVFGRMHFKVEVHEDLLASQITDVIRRFAKKDHSQMGAFVCCILSHGEKGSVLGVDGKPVEIRELTLTLAKCETLVSKPKLFFIQACQGNDVQNGVWTEDGVVNAPEEGTYEDDARMAAYRSIPIEADFLIGMATVEHYQSYRHTERGSIYIQELCKQFKELCPKGKEDVLSILTKVNYEVSTRILKGNKQMPEPRYTLTKKLVLPMD